MPRILLLYNEPVLPAGHRDAASESDILKTAEVVGRYLRDAGFEVTPLGIGENLQKLIDALRAERPDAVFNLFEGLADRPFTESVVAGVLEWFGVPFTGSPSTALTLCRDKQRAKLLLQGAGLPTAPFVVVESLPIPECHLGWPVIVKPVGQDASVGIDQESVVTEQSQLEKRIAYVLERYGPAMVEAYIPGREFHVSLFEGPAGLTHSVVELHFQGKDRWPIYSYDAKWADESDPHSPAPREVPVDLPGKFGEHIAEVARQAYRLLGCRDYARIDLRVSDDGRPYALEVNPNPDLTGGGLIAGLKKLGRPHGEFIADLAETALGRGKYAKCDGGA